MKRVIAVLLALGALVSAPAAQPAATQDIRLVLLIAVDQFRYDYLTRFRSDYTDGFKRLMTEGAMFTDASLEHYPTVTAVGHATMLTGATPSVSGIIGNDWFDRASGASVTSVSDSTVTLLGAPPAAPSGTAAAAVTGASPHRLLVDTVGDQMKMASRSPKGSPGAPRVSACRLRTARRSCPSAAAPMPRTGGRPRRETSSRARITCVSSRRGCAPSTIRSLPIPTPVARGRYSHAPRRR